MKVLIVYAHPEPSSFCAALKSAAVEEIHQSGHEAILSDLYAEGFNPVAGRDDFLTTADADRFHYQSEQLHAASSSGFAEDIVREQQRIASADAIVFLFPLWWGGPPAILKGWIDRVLAYGFAYVDGRRFDSGLFRGKLSLLCVTTGGTPARFASDGVYGEIDKVLWPIQRLTLDYMGLVAQAPFVCYAAPRVDADVRAGYLNSWRQCVHAMLENGAPARAPEPDAVLSAPMAWTRDV
jgi:NAD(P)H dehydrogenase (quinone)